MRTRDIARQLTNAVVRVSSPVNQDLTSILITAYGKDENGEDVQYYVQGMEWVPYHGFDMLDIQEVSLPGWISVRISGSLVAHVNQPDRAQRTEDVGRGEHYL